MRDDEMRELLARYGAGQVEQAEVIGPLLDAYREARAEKAERGRDDPDECLSWTAWDELGHAQVWGVITTEQYGVLADAVVAADRAG